jgi:hypothetical protein
MTKISNEAASINAPVLPSRQPVRLLSEPHAVASSHPALQTVLVGSTSHPAIWDRPMDVVSVRSVADIAAAITPSPK